MGKEFRERAEEKKIKGSRKWVNDLGKKRLKG